MLILLGSLRGKRITVQACKEFWLKCRGSEFDCKFLAHTSGEMQTC